MKISKIGEETPFSPKDIYAFGKPCHGVCIRKGKRFNGCTSGVIHHCHAIIDSSGLLVVFARGRLTVKTWRWTERHGDIDVVDGLLAVMFFFNPWWLGQDQGSYYRFCINKLKDTAPTSVESWCSLLWSNLTSIDKGLNQQFFVYQRFAGSKSI